MDNLEKIDLSIDPDAETENEEAAEKELDALSENAANAADEEPAKPKKRAGKKSVVVEADSDFEEFSPEDLDS